MNVCPVPIVKGKQQTAPPQALDFKHDTHCERKETDSAGAFTVPSVTPQSLSIRRDEWQQYYAILGMPKLHGHFTYGLRPILHLRTGGGGRNALRLLSGPPYQQAAPQTLNMVDPF